LKPASAVTTFVPAAREEADVSTFPSCKHFHPVFSGLQGETGISAEFNSCLSDAVQEKPV